ncbi:MAG: hypothetical protein Q8S73_26565 [Deltaproteobacteria bacterium]|nr:hypothetical protein [Myxococcales bacterium]MDP3217699.1 hypothetical protein [Deltaproteobacteria bacterium]
MSAPEKSDVDLYVGPDALAIDVWDRYSVRLSMLEVGLPFLFNFWHSNMGRSAWGLLTGTVGRIKCGHVVTLALDGDAVLSGLVDTLDVGDGDFGRGEPILAISGRDALGPAVSGDADPTLTLEGRRLSDAIAAVYQGVGITPDIGESVDPSAVVSRLRRRAVRRGRAHASTLRNDAVKASHPRVGERAHQVVERMCKQLGYRVWTTPVEGSGRTGVIVDRPRSGGAPSHTLRRELDVSGRVTDRSQIRWGKERTSNAAVPTAVTVFGDKERGDSPAAKVAREVTNGFLLTDAALQRVVIDPPPQPRYLQSRDATTEAGAHNEAARVCAQANEGFRRYDCGVLGHRIEGKLLLPNQVVLLTDDVVGIAGERWLIVDVEYTGDRSQDQRTRLSMVPEGALTIIPETAPT